jgi:plasmid stabilization system protein ParE
VKVVLHRRAREELIAAAPYLEEAAGLGAALLDEFDAWQRQVRKFPQSGPLIGPQIRKGILLRFNYVIAYEVRPDEIRVLYLRHAKQAAPSRGDRRR